MPSILPGSTDTRQEFTDTTKQKALERQKNKCASCGTKISALGEAGKSSHRFGERTEAHHMKHCQQGGTSDLSNCVIICKACHYNVHGGNYRNKDSHLETSSSDYFYFHGRQK